MAWLPYEDRLAGASEELVLKYSPMWSGAGETRHSNYDSLMNEMIDKAVLFSNVFRKYV